MYQKIEKTDQKTDQNLAKELHQYIQSHDLDSLVKNKFLPYFPIQASCEVSYAITEDSPGNWAITFTNKKSRTDLGTIYLSKFASDFEWAFADPEFDENAPVITFSNPLLREAMLNKIGQKPLPLEDVEYIGKFEQHARHKEVLMQRLHTQEKRVEEKLRQINTEAAVQSAISKSQLYKIRAFLTAANNASYNLGPSIGRYFFLETEEEKHLREKRYREFLENFNDIVNDYQLPPRTSLKTLIEFMWEDVDDLPGGRSPKIIAGSIIGIVIFTAIVVLSLLALPVPALGILAAVGLIVGMVGMVVSGFGFSVGVFRRGDAELVANALQKAEKLDDSAVKFLKSHIDPKHSFGRPVRDDDKKKVDFHSAPVRGLTGGGDKQGIGSDSSEDEVTEPTKNERNKIQLLSRWF